jgi:hypothetical protein
MKKKLFSVFSEMIFHLKRVYLSNQLNVTKKLDFGKLGDTSLNHWRNLLIYSYQDLENDWCRRGKLNNSAKCSFEIKLL